MDKNIKPNFPRCRSLESRRLGMQPGSGRDGGGGGERERAREWEWVRESGKAVFNTCILFYDILLYYYFILFCLFFILFINKKKLYKAEKNTRIKEVKRLKNHFRHQKDVVAFKGNSKMHDLHIRSNSNSIHSHSIIYCVIKAIFLDKKIQQILHFIILKIMNSSMQYYIIMAINTFIFRERQKERKIRSNVVFTASKVIA